MILTILSKASDNMLLEPVFRKAIIFIAQSTILNSSSKNCSFILEVEVATLMTNNPFE